MNKIIFIVLFFCCLILSKNSYGLNNTACTPSRNPSYQINIIFPRDVNPLHPFVGFLNFMATVQVINSNNQLEYENKKVRITPEVYTTDISLRGDTEGVYLRLYPQITNEQFTHYTGQLFINDLDTKSYYNFKNTDAAAGFLCH